MSSRPNPPGACTEETSYNQSDQVYYFRNGKWRHGEITGKAGTSENSKRYWVKELNSDREPYRTDIHDIRKISS